MKTLIDLSTLVSFMLWAFIVCVIVVMFFRHHTVSRVMRLWLYGSASSTCFLYYFSDVFFDKALFNRVLNILFGAYFLWQWWKTYNEDDRWKKLRKRASNKGKALLAKMGPARAHPSTN